MYWSNLSLYVAMPSQRQRQSSLSRRNRCFCCVRNDETSGCKNDDVGRLAKTVPTDEYVVHYDAFLSNGHEADRKRC